MDELRSYGRAARRLALITACGCTFVGVSAEAVLAETFQSTAPSSQTQAVVSEAGPSVSTSNLQTLLKRGWQANSDTTSIARPIPIPMLTEPMAASLTELIRQEARAWSTHAMRPPTEQFQSTANPNTNSNGIDETVGPIVVAPPLTIGDPVAVPGEFESQVQSKTEPSQPADVPELVRLNKPVSIPHASTPATVAVAEKSEVMTEPSQSSDSATAAINDSSIAGTVESKATSVSLGESRQDANTSAITRETTGGIPHTRTRNAADAQGFGMLALDCLEPPVSPVESVPAQTRLTATIHETRLRELARESLRTAVHQLSRGASHSAKRSTTEALNHVVAMLDAREGGNRHAKHLVVALDAIRESREFDGTYGAVEHDALVRMVAVHKTTVLKHQSLADTSALQAVEAYLSTAQENLVAACESIVEASDALVLMGKIEYQMHDKADTHAGAVALTYHRAAVAVDAQNAIAHRELGKTLYGQGLLEQASWSLARCVELQPTREHYRLLMQIAQETGDAETVRVCESAVNDPRLAAPLPIRHLDAEAFAATHKPTATDSAAGSIRNKTVSARTSTLDANTSDGSTQSTLSQFKSWLPKFRRE